MISVLILTLNEEANIGDCIESLPWREDVHILDSGSIDQTSKIARDLGAHVSTNDFNGYASQRNTGLSLPFKHEWVVMLDADERMTGELAAEIESEIANANSNLTMLRVRRRDIFMGRWIKRSSGYPTWFPRVFRRGRVSVEREINEEYISDGNVKQLNGHIDHYPFNKGMDWWFERHNRYSTMEARLLVARSKHFPSTRNAGDPGNRRAILKAIAYRLPFRPYLTFAYLYVVRGGFLDGKAGWTYANMRLAYELTINSKAAYFRYQKQDDIE